MCFLVLDQVAKSFGKQKVLGDVSLAVERGETVAMSARRAPARPCSCA